MRPFGLAHVFRGRCGSDPCTDPDRRGAIVAGDLRGERSGGEHGADP